MDTIAERERAEASLALLIHSHKILLILRDNIPTIASPNSWSLPGGLKEKNEDYEETCKREVEEELNLELKEIELIATLIYEKREKRFYKAKLTDEQLNNIDLKEGQKYDFFTAAEIKNLKLAKSTKLFVDRYLNLLQSV